MTIRARLEAIRDRHETDSGNWCPRCEDFFVPGCSDFVDAVAALDALDCAHRDNAFEHGDGLVVIPDTPPDLAAIWNPRGDTGIEHPGCNYLAHGGTICNKCGRLVETPSPRNWRRYGGKPRR